MFADIFKTKNTKSQSTIKPRIITDIHEKNSLVPANLQELGAELLVQSLEVGDYFINDIIIERKTMNDFISSMLSRRLLEQLKNMQQYPKKLLILEGEANKELETTQLNPNSIKGMILSASLDFNTPIIKTKNEQETANYLYLLAKKQYKPQNEISLHGRIPKTKEEQKKYILESFPGIGPKTAEKLINKFKTLKQIFSLDKKDFLDNKLLNEKTAEEFKKILEE